MKDNETKEAVETTETQEAVETTETSETQEAVVLTETQDLTKLISEIKSQYEAKIEALKDAHGKELAERDSVITQLLNDDNTAVVNETVVDKINKKRNFKKW